MNKKATLLASLCLLVMAITLSAQDKMTDFSGEWKLDVKKSELGERSRIESMTMKVTQSDTELAVERKAKRKGNDQSIGGALGGGNRGRGRQRMRGGLPSTKYDLSGKETIVEMADGIMTGETKFKAKFDSGKLMLIQNRTLNTPRGKRENKTVETWEMSKDGNTLTVSSERQTRRGTIKSKMMFTKQIVIKDSTQGFVVVRSSSNATEGFEVGSPVDPDKVSTLDVDRKGLIQGGVVNGKATSLPKPEYPEAARTLNIKGSVNVAIVIGKDGNVMSAAAVAGHPLLRKASVDAAKKAKFKPTYLEGQVVEVSGIIVYNFQ